MRSPADALLYGIIDLSYVSPENAADILEKLIAGGIDMAQLRGKKHSIDELSLLAEKLLRLTTAAEIPFIANDYAQIAQRVNVQGVTIQAAVDSLNTDGIVSVSSSNVTISNVTIDTGGATRA